MSAPTEHLEEALKLEGESYIDLFTLRLKITPVIFNFWNGPTREWDATTWEGLACQLSGEGSSTENQNNRPTLTVASPERIFGPFAAEGLFDLAEVTRKRLLQSHFVSDVGIFQQKTWIVGQVTGVLSETIQLSLRSPLDMPIWKTPRRSYTPDRFPFVLL